MAPTVAADGYEPWAYKDPDGFAGAWAMQVIAICAPAPRGYTIVTATRLRDGSCGVAAGT